VQLPLWGFWTIVWLILMPVTLVTTLKVSLEWVVFMSLFANAASCGTAWVAALSYHRARRVDEANLHARHDDHAASLDELHRKIDDVTRVASAHFVHATGRRTVPYDDPGPT
jgi:hypothetical protein